MLYLLWRLFTWTHIFYKYYCDNNRLCNGALHMTNKKILVIGGVAADFPNGRSKAKRIDPDADVKIIQDEKVVSYGACGMPYVIEGIVKEFQELIERPADVFKKKYQIDVITNTCAQKIDRVKKEVYAIDLQSGVETIYEYDSLVVATDARAILPNIKGINQKDGGDDGVFLIRNYEDGLKIHESTITKKASTRTHLSTVPLPFTQPCLIKQKKEERRYWGPVTEAAEGNTQTKDSGAVRLSNEAICIVGKK